MTVEPQTQRQQTEEQLIETLGEAIDTLSTICDGFADRTNHGSNIIRRLRDADIHEDAPDIYIGDVEMDVLRYGIPPEDALERIREQTEEVVGEVDEQVVSGVVSVLNDYADHITEDD